MLTERQYDHSLLRSCGEDNFISWNVLIRNPGKFGMGKHCAIDWGFYCTVGVELGDYVHIGPYVTVIGGADGFLRMGHFTNLASGCRLVCGTDEYLGYGLVGPPTIPQVLRDRIIVEPIVLENFVNVGTNVVIHPGVTLREGSVVGSCSLITKDTEPWTIYTGIPAKPRKKRPKDAMLRKARELGY